MFKPKNIHLFFLSSYILASCLKDKVPVPPEIKYPIRHTEYNPNETFTCVDTIIQHPSGCGMIALPADSSVLRNIDLDADGTADFQISCTSWYQTLSASFPCVNYNTSYAITALQNNGAIATTGTYNEVCKFAVNDSINLTAKWHNSASILLHVTQAPFVTDFNGLCYFGLKLTRNNGNWYGWLKLEKSLYDISLISSAIRLGPSSGIRAGQIE
jgi:hypothetical protein